MNRLSTLLVLTAFLCVSLQTVCDADATRSLLFTRTDAPAGWSIGSRAASSDSVKFLLAVKQQNLTSLESKFWLVSDPKSSEYQNFLSIQEINAIVASKPEHISAAQEWLLSNGVTPDQIITFADALEVETSVKVAELLFQTEFYEFSHAEWSRTVLRQFGSFSVPSDVLAALDLVIGVSNFPKFQGQRYRRKNTNSAFGIQQFGVIPQTTHGLYNVHNQEESMFTTSQGVIEFDFESFSQEDLAEYSNLVGIPILPVTKDHIIGNNNNYGSGTEATLDIQFLATVNDDSTNWFWLEDDTTWLYGFALHFGNATDVPSVISISYGWWEGDQCAIDSECPALGVRDDAYVTRVNTEFQKIGLRGVSIIVSSGDSGAHTRTDYICTAPTLRVDFPASSPYVTSVGATQLTNPTALANQPPLCRQSGRTCASKGVEVPVTYSVSHFVSGGGFSEVAPQPAYQRHAVHKYLSSGVPLPPSSYYNASKRGHPDVAAIGSDNLILQYGYIYSVGGTSASAPIFAAIVSKLNGVSLAESGKPLGFLNPLLYQAAAEEPSAFHDMMVGDNFCTEFGCAASCTGWYAVKGWDPVSGLGTPNYGKLAEYLRGLYAEEDA